ncbi:MAG: restriction endonuclease subunit S [Kiritimatiellae bacterium]|nr:restriction endonuclease subunit S [Kiritimatiellia bacterium]
MKWRTVALGDIAVKKGGSVNPEKYQDEVFELFSIPAFDSGKPEIVTGSKIGSAKKCVEPNDVMISRIVPHIRRAWVVHAKNIYRQIASGEWIVFRSETIWPQYLRWVLVGDTFHAEFMRTVSGVGGSLLRARPTEVFKIKIPLPPLDEQKRIAAILDAADALRAKRRESLAQLDALIQSTFLEMFGDPVTNPKGWEEKFLGKLGSLDRGVSKHRPRNEPSLLGGSHPLIQTGDVSRSNGYIRSFTSTYSDLGLKQSKMWPVGTLCITIAANIADTGILTFEACFPDSVVGFLSKEKGRAEYVQGLFLFFREVLERKAPQVAQKNINLKTLRSLPVPLPPLDLQHHFAVIVEFIEKQKALQRAHLAELDTLFAALQQRAFNGELST